MPNRIIKESICTSETIDQLTWFEEVFFYRLIVNCDDYGRMDARAAILKSTLFPLKDGITKAQIEKAIIALSTAGLVQVYEYDQKPYLQLCKWAKHQRIRNSREKYPAPNESDSPQVAASRGELPQVAARAGAESNPIQSESNPTRGRAKPERSSSDGLHSVISGYTENDELLSAIHGFLEMRKAKKKPPTERALKAIFKKMDGFCADCRDKTRYRIECLDQSTVNGWTDVYELKEFVDAEPPQQPIRDPTPEDDAPYRVHITAETTLDDILG